HGAQQAPVDRTVMKAFEDALRATGSEAQDVAWTHVIELAPNNSAAWSNRGALRLQNMRHVLRLKPVPPMQAYLCAWHS
ncbi:TPR_REGION domain-containing protein, partial [Haematococcus lacustris]